MSFTQISATNIANGSILPVQVSAAFQAEYATQAELAVVANTANTANTLAGGILKVSNVSVSNSTYTVLDDTAVNTGGGYIVVTGAGFQSGATVIVDTTTATSTTFVDNTTLRAQVPAKAAATYNIFVVNPDGGTAIKVNGLTYSASPIWVTDSALSQQINGIAFTGNVQATGATSYSVAAGSTLPTGMTLVSNGYFYGTITVESQTNYSFTINANDSELQESPRTFSMLVTLSPYIDATGGTITYDGNYRIHQFNTTSSFVVTAAGTAPHNTLEYLVVAGGGGGQCGNPNPSTIDYSGGGGGAGGYRTGNTTITTGTHTVTIGGGGVGGGYYSPYRASANGSDSIFSAIGITSTGGGNGARGSAGQTNSNGGSGGGSGGQGNTPSTSPSQGNNGGPVGYNSSHGGGGGGSLTVGGGTGSPYNDAQLGGYAKQFYGIPYAAGGGGAGNYSPNTRANGIGGISGWSPTTADQNAVANTGSGGGSRVSADHSGNGSGGTVIIRYRYQ